MNKNRWLQWIGIGSGAFVCLAGQAVRKEGPLPIPNLSSSGVSKKEVPPEAAETTKQTSSEQSASLEMRKSAAAKSMEPSSRGEGERKSAAKKAIEAERNAPPF